MPGAVNEITIHDWRDIEEKYTGKSSLLLGNGASIAFSTNFNYRSIIEFARSNELLHEEIERLFSAFDTSDFELVLRLLWQSNHVNHALNITDNSTHRIYTHLKDRLIEIVRAIHPSYQDAEPYLYNAFHFSKKFRKVISLNYDLILYWIIMYGKMLSDRHNIKDCFTRDGFYSDWKKLSVPIRNESSVTLAFYPHGNLALSRKLNESEAKIYCEESNDLLSQIAGAWDQERCIPLFVCEGTKEQKKRSINNSHYLSVVYREVLPHLGPNLVIYGWSMGEQDMHLLKQMALYRDHSVEGMRNIAVSVYNNDLAYCGHVIGTIHSIFDSKKCTIDFFHSDSPGCWIS
ncbi:DUF4917 family protein [Morganella morganii]|uniref:DUF4917 family protein n=1 Tax=Morganella morganii TaxID=582 RepID=UPI0009B7F1AC|nr:DUF4917 family protein [Morganella morganii]